MPDHDSFARKSAARAWQAALNAEVELQAVLARLERIEKRPESPHLQRCEWCGSWSLAPACREHFDLMSPTDLLEEALGG